MGWKEKFVRLISQYFFGEVLLVVASLISFPIFARILTQEEYGVMNIVTMTVELFALFGGTGLRHALFRFFSQYKKEAGYKEITLFATLFWATIAISFTGILILNLYRFIPLDGLFSEQIFQLMGFAAVLILFRTISDLILSLLRIHEKAAFYLLGNVGRRYSGMLLAIYFIVIANLRLPGFYKGIVLGEGIIFLVLVSYVSFLYRGKIFQFSKHIFSECARYGFPLVGQNLSNFINSVGDRYIILFFRGEAAVGIYSIGYSLATYIKSLFVDTLETALVPMTMNIAAKAGESQTKAFLTYYFSIYSFIFFPVIAGLTAIARDAIIVIASPKFEASSTIVGYVVIGIMLSGSFFPMTVGLHLKKKTMVIAKIMFLAASFNILLNLIFVPLWGITGAAIATLLSCLYQIGYGYYKSTHYLKFKHNFRFYLVCFFCSTLMFLSIWLLPVGPEITLANLILKIFIGIVVYLTTILLIDKTSRNLLKFLWTKIKEH